jgi:hypothetical protein
MRGSRSSGLSGSLVVITLPRARDGRSSSPSSWPRRRAGSAIARPRCPAGPGNRPLCPPGRHLPAVLSSLGDVVFSLGGFDHRRRAPRSVERRSKALLRVLSMIVLSSIPLLELNEGTSVSAPKVLVPLVSFMHRYGYLLPEESGRASGRWLRATSAPAGWETSHLGHARRPVPPAVTTGASVYRWLW